jgi:hypothetical protein
MLCSAPFSASSIFGERCFMKKKSVTTKCLLGLVCISMTSAAHADPTALYTQMKAAFESAPPAVIDDLASSPSDEPDFECTQLIHENIDSIGWFGEAVFHLKISRPDFSYDQIIYGQKGADYKQLITNSTTAQLQQMTAGAQGTSWTSTAEGLQITQGDTVTTWKKKNGKIFGYQASQDLIHEGYVLCEDHHVDPPAENHFAWATSTDGSTICAPSDANGNVPAGETGVDRGYCHNGKYVITAGTDGNNYCFPEDYKNQIVAGESPVDPSYCGAEAAPQPAPQITTIYVPQPAPAPPSHDDSHHDDNAPRDDDRNNDHQDVNNQRPQDDHREDNQPDQNRQTAPQSGQAPQQEQHQNGQPQKR